MRKTKRDIHKEIMYNKIMPTSYAKKNGDEPAGTENSVPTISFPEETDINDIIQSELPAVPNPADEQEMMESPEEIADKIDTENENIVKILSEYNEYKEKKSALRKNKAEKLLKKKELENAKKKEKEISQNTENIVSDDADEEDVQNILNEIISKEGISEKISENITDNSEKIEEISDEENKTDDTETEIKTETVEITENEVSDTEEPDEEIFKTEEISDNSDSEDYSDIFGSDEDEEINSDNEEISENTEENIDESDEDEDEMFGGSEEITELNDSDEKSEEKTAPEPEIKEEIKQIFPKVANVKEIIVNNHIDEILDKFNCCKCTSCKLEITSNALNKLTPQYIIVNNEDEMNVDVTETDYSEITSALIHAIIAIRANPIH